jgi:hypothetical protein
MGSKGFEAMLRIIGLLLVIVGLVGAAISEARAQGGSPSPDECREPAVVSAPGFPETEGPAKASPAASPRATPLPVTNDPVSPETAQQIAETAQSLAACISEGNVDGVVALATSEFLGDLYSGGERLSAEEYRALAALAPVVPIHIRSVSEPVFDGLSTASADIEFVAGNQLRLERWTFLFRHRTQPSDGTAPGTDLPGVWLAHRTTPLEASPPAGAERLTAELDEYSLLLSAGSVDGPALAITGRNTGDEAHELLVLRLVDGATTDLLIRPGSDAFPASIEVAGQVSILPGASADLVLVDLEAGDYAVVCLFPDASGVPHLVLGQQAALAVE